MDAERDRYRKVVRDEWTNADTVAGWTRWHDKANMEFAVADAEHLQFEPASFDRVTSRPGAMYFVDAQRLSPPAPPADAPQPLRFAPAGKLADALTSAGFRDVREDREVLVLPWPGPPDELWRHLYDIAIPLRPLFDGLSGRDRQAAIDESVAGYAKYYDGKTVNVPASIVTVSARA